MGRSLKFTGNGYQSVRQNIFHRYLTSVYQIARPSANTSLPASWCPCRPGMAYRAILTTRTGEAVSGTCRSTPPCFPSAIGVGVKYHIGALGTGIMSQKILARGGTPEQTYETKTLLQSQPGIDKCELRASGAGCGFFVPRPHSRI